MQAVLQPSKQFKHVLEWCLVGSILAHLVIMFAISKPTYEVKHPPKEEIRIELVKQLAPDPVHPEAPKPEPAKPEVQPPPKPTPDKPLPSRAEPKPVAPQKPSPSQEPPAEQRLQPPAESTQAPSVIAVKPTASESKPEMVTAPAPAPIAPPEPVKASGPSEGDIEAARNAFRNAAHRELKKNQRYPRIAQDRGIEGDVKLSINLDDHGTITGIEVIESSGNKAIDDAAIAAAQKSQLKPHFNEILRGRINNIIVTVSFKLIT